MASQQKSGFFKVFLGICLTLIGSFVICNTMSDFLFLQRTYKSAIIAAKASSNYFAEISLMLSLDFINMKMLIFFICSILLACGVYFIFGVNNDSSKNSTSEDSQTSLFSVRYPGIFMVLASLITIIIISYRTPKLEFIANKTGQNFASISEKLNDTSSLSADTNHIKQEDKSEHQHKTD